MMAIGKPPILLLVVAQLMSVVNRHDHKGSRRHMLITTTLLSGIQVLAIVALAQIFFTDETRKIYIDSKEITCYKETLHGSEYANCTALEHTDHPCTPVPCRSQGVTTFLQDTFLYHPLLLWNNVINLVYYISEFMLYREPLGLLFLSIAALTSSFLINPLSIVLGHAPGKDIPLTVLITGITGGVMCVVEQVSEKTKPMPKRKSAIVDDATPRGDDTPLISGSESPSKELDVGRFDTLKAVLRLFPAFLGLSVAYAFWFVIQMTVNDIYYMNVFGYNCLDKGLFLVYLWGFLYIEDAFKPCKMYLERADDAKETLIEAAKNAFKEANWINIFIFRLLINGRAFVYFYLAIFYDLNMVYLELTLMRILMSWLGSIVLCLWFPKFLMINADERAKTFAVSNMVRKTVGSVLILTSLLILNSK